MRIRPSVRLLLLVALCTANLKAQAQVAQQFESRSHTFKGTTVRYALFVPEAYDPSQAYPLVLVFHGFAELTSVRIATAWAEPTNQMYWPTFVVAVFGDGGSNPEAPVATVVDLLDSLGVEFNIDDHRLYVTGYSIGGSGTFYSISHHPDRFAAAIPISGRGLPEYASRFHNVSLWAFHGEIDPTVPAEGSREMIFASEAAGRRAVYTHCNSSDCAPLPDSVLSKAIEQHANLLYTEFPGVGHSDMVDRSLDHPRLFPWVFSQYRSGPDTVQITEPSGYPTLAGTAQLKWNITNPADSMEIWFSPDDGKTWELVSADILNTGSYDLNTVELADTPFARVRLLPRNAQGFIYGRDESGLFNVDNSLNGVPFVGIEDRDWQYRTPMTSPKFELRFRACDAEFSKLSAQLLFSADGGQSFAHVSSFDVDSDTAYQVRTVDLDALPNTPRAVFRLEVSDGESTGADVSPVFRKQTSRTASTFVDHVGGVGDATITLHFVNEDQLTGHRYRIMFNDTTFDATTYGVVDLETDVIVLENEPTSNGVLESPLFDGMRLVVQAREETQVDLAATGWIEGNTNLGVSISAPEVGQGPGIPPLKYLATPTDYRLEISNGVVDTSRAGPGFSASPMRFSVQNLGAGRRSEILFKDRDEDGLPSPTDYLDVLEPNEQGRLTQAWRLSFSGGGNTVAPVAGDVFVLITKKPVTARDVYEFQAIVGLASENGNPFPVGFLLEQNYPNPFNPTTRISYALPRFSEATLTVYDMLGRRVSVLASGLKPAGNYEVSFDATGLPSGVYFYRLQAGDYVVAKRMVVVR